jgi:ATP-dependent Zn protease
MNQKPAAPPSKPDPDSEKRRQELMQRRMRYMVTESGMSDQLGRVRYAGQQMQYLGGAVEDNSAISLQTRQAIDAEVQRLVTTQYERAQCLLLAHCNALETLTRQLLTQETVNGSAVQAGLGATPSPIAN